MLILVNECENSQVHVEKKCEDPCLGMLEYHNTPITGMKNSPNQLLINRSTRSIIQVLTKTLKSAMPSNAQSKMIAANQKQKVIMKKLSSHY